MNRIENIVKINILSLVMTVSMFTFCLEQIQGETKSDRNESHVTAEAGSYPIVDTGQETFFDNRFEIPSEANSVQS